MENEKPEEILPEGKVRTVSGEIIDRADACFLLAPVPGTNLFIARDERVYKRGKGGQLRRFPPKEKGKKKKKRGAKNEDQ